jgi:magnesium chelatase family protein
VLRYQKKISGPLLDRIDLQLRVGRIPLDDLRKSAEKEKPSAEVRKEVERARAIQSKRLAGTTARVNAEMTSQETEKFANLTSDAEKFLPTLHKAHLSPRSFYRILKTARTIADLGGENQISPEHLAEAFSYRLREEI